MNTPTATDILELHARMNWTEVPFYDWKNRLCKGYVQVGEQEYLLEVFYDIGGWDHFRGVEHSRGYWMLVRPVTRGNGITTIRLFDAGLKELIEPATRYNANRLSNWADEIFCESGYPMAPMMNLLARVVKRKEMGVTG